MKYGLMLILALAVIGSVCVTAAFAQADPDAQRVAKVKKEISKMDVNERVNIKTMNGTVLKGRIKEIGDDYFVMIENRTGDSTVVKFAQVKKVGFVFDNPLRNPGVVLGLAVIPVIIVAAVMSRGY